MTGTATKLQRIPEVKTPPILFEKTQQILAQIEERLGEPLVTYWNSPNGSICSNDVVGLYGADHLPKRQGLALSERGASLGYLKQYELLAESGNG